MRRGLRILMGGLLLGLWAATMSPVSAQEIVFEGGECPLPVAGSEDAAASEQLLSSLTVIGRYDGGIIVLTEEGVGYVTEETAAALLPDLDMASLPDAGALGTISPASAANPDAKTLQEMLVELGLLSGDKTEKPDGIYGATTANAIRAFQTENKLKATGEADPITQLLLGIRLAEKNGEAPEVLTEQYPPVYKEEVKFAQIYENCADDLTPYLDATWLFTYDVESGLGLLDKGLALGLYTEEETDLKRIYISATCVVCVKRDKEGQVSLTPALRILSRGAVSPYLQGVILENGSEYKELKRIRQDRTVDGIDALEDDYYSLPKGAGKLMKMSGTVIHLKGLNDSWDLEIAEPVAEELW